MVDWVKQLTRLRGYTDQMVEDANALIYTFGSYRLGVRTLCNCALEISTIYYEQFAIALSFIYADAKWSL